MKELIDRLHKAIEDQKLVCATTRPDSNKEPAYLMGYMQGKYSGLNTALDIVKSFLNDQFEEEEE